MFSKSRRSRTERSRGSGVRRRLNPLVDVPVVTTVTVRVRNSSQRPQMEVRTRIVISGVNVADRPVRMRRRRQLAGEVQCDQQDGGTASKHNLKIGNPAIGSPTAFYS